MDKVDFYTKKNAPVFLMARDIAILLDLKKRTILQYLLLARRHYKDGCVKPFDFPLPDALAGFSLRAPLWRYNTIREWAAQRPQTPVMLPKSDAEGLALLHEYSEDMKD